VTYIGSANGFRIYSPDSAEWVPATPYGEFLNDYLPDGLVWQGSAPHWQIYDGGLFVKVFSVDGSGADTIGFAGYQMDHGTGLYPGFDAVGIGINIARIPESSRGKTLCIDSCYWPPAGTWKWANGFNILPYWDGPHCFEIGDCCVGMRGNVDLTDDGITIADVTALVHQLYVKRELECPKACNVDGDKNETVDIVDLVYLIDYMFRGGPAPAACP
jgi:hypothetical protein